ncbi:MAG: hypothetical protein P8X83_03390 [Nitrosopumilaceae archaeon]
MTARKLYGDVSYKKKKIPKHQENIQRMLHILAINGPLTTWGMAKEELFGETSKVRTREKQYRKFLIGREDRGKHSAGILEIGLVVTEGKRKIKAPANVYRLSLHGILYCLDVLDLTNKEIDMMGADAGQVSPGQGHIAHEGPFQQRHVAIRPARSGEGSHPASTARAGSP